MRSSFSNLCTLFDNDAEWLEITLELQLEKSHLLYLYYLITENPSVNLNLGMLLEQRLGGARMSCFVHLINNAMKTII